MVMIASMLIRVTILSKVVMTITRLNQIQADRFVYEEVSDVTTYMADLNEEDVRDDQKGIINDWIGHLRNLLPNILDDL